MTPSLPDLNEINVLQNINGIQARKRSQAVGSDGKQYKRVVSIYQQQANLNSKY